MHINSALILTAGESCVRLLDVDGDGLEDILVGTATSRKHFDVEASVGTGKYDDLKDLCHEQGWYEFHYYQTAFVPQREMVVWGFRPGPIQTGLYSHRSWLEA